MSKIYVDNKTCDAAYIDKYNNHLAANNEIIKFVVDRENESSTRRLIAELVASNLNLRGHARAAFITLICYCNGKSSSRFKLAKDTIKYLKLNAIPQTIVQRVDEMYKNFIILMGDNGYEIKINPKYYINDLADNAKFLVLELNPKETSAPIEL